MRKTLIVAILAIVIIVLGAFSAQAERLIQSKSPAAYINTATVTDDYATDPKIISRIDAIEKREITRDRWLKKRFKYVDENTERVRKGHNDLVTKYNVTAGVVNNIYKNFGKLVDAVLNVKSGEECLFKVMLVICLGVIIFAVIEFFSYFKKRRRRKLLAAKKKLAAAK